MGYVCSKMPLLETSSGRRETWERMCLTKDVRCLVGNSYNRFFLSIARILQISKGLLRKTSQRKNLSHRKMMVMNAITRSMRKLIVT